MLWNYLVIGARTDAWSENGPKPSTPRCGDRPSGSVGVGIDPRARLDLACAAYALAESMNSPLLFKGDDFAATDVLVCL